MPSDIPQPTADQAEFLGQLFDAGHLIPTGVPGVYGHSDTYERIRDRFETMVSRIAAQDGAVTLKFPPVLPRLNLEQNGYVAKFPQLAASIFSFQGSEADALKQGRLAAAHEDWSGFQKQTDLMMLPAACYPVYPAVAARGPLDAGGVSIDMQGTWVFRHEPSLDPARQQIFRQHELIRMGVPDEVVAWRLQWARRALELFGEIGLEGSVQTASDPFFGRQGLLLAANQNAEELKFELVVQIAGPEPTACASFNYHVDQFAGVYGLKFTDGAPLHTACVGFGQDRIVLALMRTHGLDPAQWPASVRARVWD
ncbi:MAG: amino acid--[acyl-carrier-protein] ligase [Solirubrobacteraceae bacterium]